MLCLQLFAILVALTFSDGAVLRNPKCEYGEGSTFCQLIRKVYRQNRENLHHLTVNRFHDARDRLTTAIQAVRELLATKDKDALLEHLSRALDSESGTMFEVRRKCNNNLTKPPCYTIFRGLFYATTYLVEAAIEVTDGQKKETIEKLYEAFKNEGKPAEKVYALATNVLSVLGQH